MAKEQEVHQVRGEVSPGGTEGGRRPTGAAPRGGSSEAIGPGSTFGRRPGNARWCCVSSEASPWSFFPGSWASNFTDWKSGETPL